MAPIFDKNINTIIRLQRNVTMIELLKFTKRKH